uniref:Uncharacterized protein n=1 Tax=Anguilla anguilla TaxID=7936 RepID=A0A0E9R0H4_ANGAN
MSWILWLAVTADFSVKVWSLSAGACLKHPYRAHRVGHEGGLAKKPSGVSRCIVLVTIFY